MSPRVPSRRRVRPPTAVLSAPGSFEKPTVSPATPPPPPPMAMTAPVRQETPAPQGGIWYFLSVVIPFAGIVIALFLYDQDSWKVRKIGRNCLLIGFLIWVLLPLASFLAFLLLIALAIAGVVSNNLSPDGLMGLTPMPVLLISGGTRGIGLTLSRAFAQKGWAVATCYHQDEDSARQASTELGNITTQFSITKCDVSQAGQVESLVAGVMEKWGRVDCLIHNAGATWNARILNVEEPQWDDTQGVHLKGAFLLSKSCLKPMLKQKSGHLIFISSVVATTGNVGQGAYTAAKAGLIGFSRSLAQEYGGRNIRANVVFPGFHKTRIVDNLSSEAEEAIRNRHLLGKTTDLNEVGDFMVWLASTKTISGQVFNLDSRLPGWL